MLVQMFDICNPFPLLQFFGFAGCLGTPADLCPLILVFFSELSFIKPILVGVNVNWNLVEVQVLLFEFC